MDHNDDMGDDEDDSSVEEINESNPSPTGPSLIHISKNKSVVAYPYPKRIIWYLGIHSIDNFGHILKQEVFLLFLEEIVRMNDHQISVVTRLMAVLEIVTAPLAGVLADNYIGKYRQMIIAHIVDLPIISLTSLVTIYPTLPAYQLTCVEMFFSGLAAPFYYCCINTFAGQQFHFPEQTGEFREYLIIAFWVKILLSLVGHFSSMFVKNNFHCVGQKHCYFPCLMSYTVGKFILIVCLILSSQFFTKLKPEKEHTIVHAIKLMSHAKHRSKMNLGKHYWMDYADDKYDQTDIDDVKRMKMFVIVLTVPIIEAGMAQEHDNWYFQGKSMDGDLGYFHVYPEYLFGLHYAFSAVFIPFIIFVLFPLFDKYDIKLLQRLGIAGYLFTISFFICGILCLHIEDKEPKLPQTGESQIFIYNNLNTKLYMYGDLFNEPLINVSKMSYYRNYSVKVSDDANYPVYYYRDGLEDIKMFWVNITEKTMTSFYFLPDGTISQYSYNINLDKLRQPSIRTIVCSNNSPEIFYKSNTMTLTVDPSKPDLTKLKADKYRLYVENEPVYTTKIRLGGVYVTLITELSNGTFVANIMEVHSWNFVTILWIIPQYVIRAFAEPLYVVAMEEFLYTQSPVRMKAFAVSVDRLGRSIGYLFATFVDYVVRFEYHSTSSFFYFALLHMNMVLFIFLAMWYEYVPEMNFIKHKTKRMYPHNPKVLPRNLSGYINIRFSRMRSRVRRFFT